MSITPQQILRIRAIAEADMKGADGKAWDEAITPAVVIALCDKVERLDKEADWLAYGYTNAVDLLGMCPCNVDMTKCRDSTCTDCMRDAARKTVEEACPKN